MGLKKTRSKKEDSFEALLERLGGILFGSAVLGSADIYVGMGFISEQNT